MLSEIVNWIISTVGTLGYMGIVVMMFLESSFFPFPSEVVMIPAGYLASQGEMSLTMVLFCGILGAILGSLFNYWLAYKFGRKVILKFGKYFFMDENRLMAIENYFYKHGHISTFIGRLIPGVRQYISLPAGLGKMDLRLFTIFTALGAGLWVIVLVLLGYFIGQNQALIKEYLHLVMAVLAFVLIIMSVWYIKRNKKHHETLQ
ncbi:DedA family protein [Sulfurospirillum sp. 1612]|uniref:DedA family protein n=1 Tax=Sulfurospirillum sp. 1612 TaxID=3094835 RepID=UPI002F94EBA3